MRNRNSNSHFVLFYVLVTEEVPVETENPEGTTTEQTVPELDALEGALEQAVSESSPLTGTEASTLPSAEVTDVEVSDIEDAGWYRILFN